LQKFDKLFDILNTRSPHGKFSKEPIKIMNWRQTEDYLSYMEDYIKQLRRNDGALLLTTKR
jgi:hypothetical protein